MAPSFRNSEPLLSSRSASALHTILSIMLPLSIRLLLSFYPFLLSFDCAVIVNPSLGLPLDTRFGVDGTCLLSERGGETRLLLESSPCVKAAKRHLGEDTDARFLSRSGSGLVLQPPTGHHSHRLTSANPSPLPLFSSARHGCTRSVLPISLAQQEACTDPLLLPLLPAASCSPPAH